MAGNVLHISTTCKTAARRRVQKNCTPSHIPTVNQRLKRLRDAATPPISTAAMAESLGMSKSAYHFYESESAHGFKQPFLPISLARRIADVLAERGVGRGRVLALADAAETTSTDLSEGEKAWLVVWRAMTPGQRRIYMEQVCCTLGWAQPEGEPNVHCVLENAA